METNIYARKTDDGRLQTIRSHLDGVASYACSICPSNLKSTVELLCELHDAGKCDTRWQDYLLNGGERVAHSPVSNPPLKWWA